MSAQALLVNAFDPWRPHVPMGLFGMCDYLRQRNQRSRMFNASLYGHEEYVARLVTTMEELQPELVGVVLHWKELAYSALYLSWLIKKRFPSSTVLLGGFTAGYFGQELLVRWPHLDAVVRGDGEMALEHLLGGGALADAPNVFFRDGETIRMNPCQALGEDALDQVSYSDLTFLLDYPSYVERITSGRQVVLNGMPVFVGKGCGFDCPFCGGSSKSYREHSGRDRVVRRSVEAILRDLHRLASFTDYIHLCHETSKEHIYRLLEAIAADPQLARKLYCSYESWSVMDTRMIDLYRAAFRLDGRRRPTIAISPETTDDQDRMAVRDHPVCFTNAELLASLQEITEKLGGGTCVHVFFSRFHSMQTQEKLRQELERIHDLCASIFGLGLERHINVHYLALSTDPASHYWDEASRGLSRDDMLSRLLESHKALVLPTAHSQSEWMVLYRPPGLSAESARNFSGIVRLFELLTPLPFGYYFHVARLLGFDAIWSVLQDIIVRPAESQGPDVWELIMGGRTSAPVERDAVLLLALFHDAIVRRHAEALHPYRSFVDGLYAVETAALRTAGGFRALPTAAVLEAEPVEGQRLTIIDKPRLALERLVVVDYRFSSRDFFRQLAPNGLPPKAEKTIYFFLPGGTAELPYSIMPVLCAFDGQHTVAQVMEMARAAKSLPEAVRSALVEQVIPSCFYFTD